MKGQVLPDLVCIFRYVLMNAGEPLNEQEAELMMKEADKDGDGTIDYEGIVSTHTFLWQMKDALERLLPTACGQQSWILLAFLRSLAHRGQPIMTWWVYSTISVMQL